MRRLSAATCVLLGTALGAAGCSGGSDDADGSGAEAVAQQLAGALTARGQEKAGAPSAFDTVPFTPGAGRSAGEAVAKDYDAVVAGMDGLVPKVAVDGVEESGARATATLRWSWPVVDGEQPWTYSTSLKLARTGKKWAATWARSVVEPDLAEGDVLDAVTQPTDRGDITGAGGKVLVTERPVVRVGIDRTRVGAAAAAGSARRLARLVGITPAPYVKAVRDAGARAFVEAITYRKGEVPRPVDAGVRSIPGGLQQADEVALAPSREFAAPILGRVGQVTSEMVKKDPGAYRPGDVAGVSGLEARYDDQLRGSVGRIVYAVPEDAAAQKRTLWTHDATPGKPLAITLDQRLQLLAERVLGKVGPASALVAIRPSDGSILAAASGPGSNGLNSATYGRFAPGSTFKTVSSLALLRAGVTPETPLTCPATLVVDGKRFKNYSDYPASSLGTIPLREAVAQSCNTAFIGARGKIHRGDLASAAASLGLGVDHDLGFPAYFGQVPDPASDTEAAADLIGQGKILASPMAMATVIASVQAGKTVVPRLVEQVDVEVPESAKPLKPAEAAQLKALLRGVVERGSGRGLLDVPGPPVIAKTGTAEYADKSATRTHAWMVAAQGDLAVAVFVQTGESGSKTAGPLLEQFLRGAR